MSDTVDTYENDIQQDVALRGTAGDSPLHSSDATATETVDLLSVNPKPSDFKISTLDGLVNLLNDSDATNLPDFISKAAGFIKKPSQMASIIEQLLSNYVLDRIGNIGLPDDIYDEFKKNYLSKCVSAVLSFLTDKFGSIDCLSLLLSGELNDPVSLIEDRISDYVDEFLEGIS